MAETAQQRTLSSLKAEAQIRAVAKRHDLGDWRDGLCLSMAVCRRCKGLAFADSEKQEIAGSALDVACPAYPIKS